MSKDAHSLTEHNFEVDWDNYGESALDTNNPHGQDMELEAYRLPDADLAGEVHEEQMTPVCVPRLPLPVIKPRQPSHVKPVRTEPRRRQNLPRPTIRPRSS